MIQANFIISGSSEILLYRFHLSYDEKMQAHLSELAQKHTQKIDTYLVEKLKNIRFLSRNVPSEKNAAKLFLEERLNILKNEYDDAFTDLGLIDEDGTQFAYAGPFKLENALYKKAAWYQESLKKDFYISDVFIGLRGHPHFIVTVKINNNGNHWILRATINFGAFNEVVESIQIGQTGIAFIVNENGSFNIDGYIQTIQQTFGITHIEKTSSKTDFTASLIL